MGGLTTTAVDLKIVELTGEYFESGDDGLLRLSIPEHKSAARMNILKLPGKLMKSGIVATIEDGCVVIDPSQDGFASMLKAATSSAEARINRNGKDEKIKR